MLRDIVEAGIRIHARRGDAARQLHGLELRPRRIGRRQIRTALVLGETKYAVRTAENMDQHQDDLSVGKIQ